MNINKKVKKIPRNKNKEYLGMVFHAPPLNEVKKQGEMPLPSLSPIPYKNVELRDGDVIEAG